MSRLWIHKAIAVALDAKDAETMRNAFTTSLFNKRGVHGFTAGKEEQAIAAGYHEKAAALESVNFHRIADTVRTLAKGYERDALREAENNSFVG